MASFNKVYHAMPPHGNSLCPIMQWSARSASCALSYDAAVSGPSVSAARSSHCCESQVCSQLNSIVWLNNNEPFFSNLIEIESQQPSYIACLVCWCFSSFCCILTKLLSPVISRHSFRNSLRAPWLSCPPTRCSRLSELLTVSDARNCCLAGARVIQRESCSDMIDGNGYQLFTAQKIKYWGKNSNKT